MRSSRASRFLDARKARSRCGERGSPCVVSALVIPPVARRLAPGFRPRCTPAGEVAASTTVPGIGHAPRPRGAPMVDLAGAPLPVRRVGSAFIALYAAAYMGTSLMLVAPLLV